jgi:hypothetical protein
VWRTVGEAEPDLFWEGDLVSQDLSSTHRHPEPEEPVVRTSERSPRDLPVAGIGRPLIQTLAEFSASNVLSPAAQLKLEGADIYLVEFFCSLRPRRVGAVKWARFVVRWPDASPNIRALDIYPREAVRELQRDVKVTIGGNLDFMVLNADIGEFEAGVKYTELQPIVSGSGVGEDVVVWDYRPARGLPLLGGKYMHAVIEAPRGTPSATVRLDLTVDVGGVRGFLPRSQNAPGMEVTLW